MHRGFSLQICTKIFRGVKDSPKIMVYTLQFTHMLCMKNPSEVDRSNILYPEHSFHCNSLFFFFFSLYILFLYQDESDVVFRATTGKWRAVVVEISRMYKTGRPVLVGTTSVEQSDALSEQLREAGIPHEVRSINVH